MGGKHNALDFGLDRGELQLTVRPSRLGAIVGIGIGIGARVPVANLN